MTVDRLDRTPLRERLAAIIAAKSKGGEYEPRQVSPSESRPQGEHGVSRGAIRRAMRHLGELGWTVTVQGRGTFVAPTENRPAE
ncbi:GntR family transcriptional regulator [Streptosporangium sp. G11]|uniref:GntR family transcriptional regulator n=1 Tax=Streptosporangium sp. G11 TaxID=3436926 RepID=UPI003EB90981